MNTFIRAKEKNYSTLKGNVTTNFYCAAAIFEICVKGNYYTLLCIIVNLIHPNQILDTC